MSIFNLGFFKSLPLLSLLSGYIIEHFFLNQQNMFFPLDKLILYFWLLYRPDLISYLFLGLLYLFLDVLQGWMLGFNPLLILLFSWIVLIQRPWAIKRNFSLQWLLLVGSLSIYLTMLWLLKMIVEYKGLTSDVFVSYMVGILLYPFIVRILYPLYILIPLPQSYKA